MRNITIESGGSTLSFNEDGVVTDNELKIVNINPSHEWEQVYLYAIYLLDGETRGPRIRQLIDSYGLMKSFS